jgi:hypothetical protein
MTTNNPYSNLRLYWERHQYKRGQFKGDAPFAERYASHKRILTPSEHRINVQMHNTIIMTAFPDGTFQLDTGGWHEAPTTREAIGEVLSIAGLRGYMCSHRIGNYSQTALWINGYPKVRFEDGMRFAPDGALLSERPKWKRYVADREARAEKRAELKPLLDVLPILHAGLFNDASGAGCVDVRSYDPDNPENWQKIVREYTLVYDKQPHGWVLDTDWRAVRARLVAAATRGMNVLIEVDE